jgi:hypothetical protein
MEEESSANAIALTFNAAASRSSDIERVIG